MIKMPRGAKVVQTLASSEIFATCNLAFEKRKYFNPRYPVRLNGRPLHLGEEVRLRDEAALLQRLEDGPRIPRDVAHLLQALPELAPAWSRNPPF